MITLEKVRKRYSSGHDALRSIDLTISKSELLYLTGHSGAGKSTLLRLIALLERPSAGKILFDGNDLAHLSQKQIPAHRRRIGVIFQNPSLLGDRSVYENVALPLQVAGYRYTEISNRVNAALDLVGLLSKARQSPTILSGGEQQRVGIARAIVSRPELILADEPTGNLDPELSTEIIRLFVRLNQVGITLIIATHDLSLIDSKKYRQVELSQGIITQPSDSISANS